MNKQTLVAILCAAVLCACTHHTDHYYYNSNGRPVPHRDIRPAAPHVKHHVKKHHKDAKHKYDKRRKNAKRKHDAKRPPYKPQPKPTIPYAPRRGNTPYLPH